MQTSYGNAPAKALEGDAHGSSSRKSRPRTIASLPGIYLLTSDAGDGTDDLVITIVDDQTGQTYEVTADGSATEATVLANALEALREDADVNALFSVSGEVDTDVLITFTARHANRSYTITATGGPDDANAVTTVQAPGGSKIKFGRFVARSGEGTIRAPASGDTIGDLEGVLFRTDGNHSQEYPQDSAGDGAAPARTMSVMEDGRVWLRTEDQATAGGAVYVRISGTGDPGAIRATADGGNTIDATSIAKFESDAAAGELALVRVRVL